MKIWNILLIITLSLTKLTACADGGWFSAFVKENNYDFLDASLINLDEENPLYKLSASGVYSYDERVRYFKEKAQKLNVQEWQRYFDNRLTFQELDTLFYTNDEKKLDIYNRYKSKIDNKNFEKYFKYLLDQEENAQRRKKSVLFMKRKFLKL